ncbi:MAG: hypothetical protein DME19_13260 [Verrucomicrobia bacterium]|nr:MAG: hypothetical protein DME19_13260 [Verrucomicrobiota bacterium]
MYEQHRTDCNLFLKFVKAARKKSRKLTRRRFLRHALWAGPLLAVGDAFALEPEWVKVRTVRPCPGKSTGRFVQFSDVHHKGDHAYLQSVVDRINKLSPEFVCFTGDIVEDAKFLSEALQLMRAIKSPVYGIPGNHDYWSHADLDVIAKSFSATGGAWLLDQEIVTADNGINIIGATCMKAPNVRPRAGMRNILLIHYPAWVEKLAGQEFDLILAGHSHGGQVRIPFYGPLMVPFGVNQYDLGLFRTPSGPLYVNADIGYFHLNVRFNCRPEITVFEI